MVFLEGHTLGCGKMRWAGTASKDHTDCGARPNSKLEGSSVACKHIILLLGTAFQKRYTGFRTTLCSFSKKKSDSSHAHITQAHAHKPTSQWSAVRDRVLAHIRTHSRTHSLSIAHSAH